MDMDMDTDLSGSSFVCLKLSSAHESESHIMFAWSAVRDDT